MSSKVIGEGTYGCVHRPPLLCKGKTKTNPDEISKLMTKSEIKTELGEYKHMQDIDKDKKYFLGKPESCDLTDNDETRKAIKLCKISSEVLEHFNNYALLILKDGGENLETYAQKLAVRTATKAAKDNMELFWIEAHNLFMGVKIMLDNGLIHHDLKPQNIVYNEENNRLVFIDFGFMTKKDTVLKECKQGRYWLSEVHWSFPLGMQYINKHAYSVMSKRSRERRDDLFREMVRNIKMPLEQRSNKNNSILTFWHYVKCKTNSSYLQPINDCKKPFNDFLLDYVAGMFSIAPGDDNYYAYLNKILNTIDSYGLGFALQHVLMNSSQLISESLASDLNTLFYSMYTPNQVQTIEIDDAIIQYEECLAKNGILKKHNVYFDNHVLKKGQEVPKGLVTDISNIKPSDVKISKEILAETMKSLTKDCPSGKELNPKTKRCVKVCKDGFQRNASFKCSKIRKVKSKQVSRKKIKERKECPQGKELNPKTRRCVKVCKEGYERDVRFKCKKTRTRHVARSQSRTPRRPKPLHQSSASLLRQSSALP